MIPEEIAEKAIDSPNSHRYKCKVRDNQEVGRWKKSEHENFIKGLTLYGKDWKKIEALIGTRNGAQIRSHAQKYFSKIGKSIDFRENIDPESLLSESEHCIKREDSLGGSLSISGERKRDSKFIYKELESFSSYHQEDCRETRYTPKSSILNFKPTQGDEKKYTEEDLLQLIKFIIKEFSSIIQKWSFTQNQFLPIFNLCGINSQNINSLLLSSLQLKERSNQQAGNLIQQILMKGCSEEINLILRVCKLIILNYLH